MVVIDLPLIFCWQLRQKYPLYCISNEYSCEFCAQCLYTRFRFIDRCTRAEQSGAQMRNAAVRLWGAVCLPIWGWGADGVGGLGWKEEEEGGGC